MRRYSSSEETCTLRRSAAVRELADRLTLARMAAPVSPHLGEHRRVPMSSAATMSARVARSASRCRTAIFRSSSPSLDCIAPLRGGHAQRDEAADVAVVRRTLFLSIERAPRLDARSQSVSCVSHAIGRVVQFSLPKAIPRSLCREISRRARPVFRLRAKVGGRRASLSARVGLLVSSGSEAAVGSRRGFRAQLAGNADTSIRGRGPDLSSTGRASRTCL